MMATGLVAGTCAAVIVLASVGASAPRAQPSDAPAIHFTDVTAECGIDMTWTSGEVPSKEILEVKGGGIALIDYDEDGDLDVFVPNGATMASPDKGPGCRLYENLGGLRFRDATADAGLTFDRWGIGVAVGDYDADGHDDLYVTCYGRNALLRNLGDGRFEEVTDAAGVGGDEWSAAAAFGDLDADGDLDLYVANYLDFDIANPPAYSTFKNAPVFTGPRGLPPTHDRLYENLGDGTFRDISESSGCRAVAPAFGLGTVILDFDADGRQDIYVGNDSTPNFLFLNRGGLHFDEVGLQTGLATNIDGSEQSTMGIAIGDVSGNGFPDIFTTNFSNDSNTIHINKEGAFFDDETRRYGLGMLSFPYVGWAAGLYDFDHDADEDILLFNGHVYPNASPETMDSTYDEPPLLFACEGRRFVPVDAATAGTWLDEGHCDRGAAFGDLDRDGDIDVVVVELNGPIRVLRNDAPSNTHWLTVALQPAPGASTLGSRIQLIGADLTQTRWIYSGGSFASASAQEAHFGLGTGEDKASLVVTWPDGHEQRIDDVSPNQHLVVRREP
jgi:hypothetical protein